MKICTLVLFFAVLCNISFAQEESCGIEEDYLESFGFILYGISELSERNNTSPIDSGSLIFSWNLECEEEEVDSAECESGNCDTKCGAIRTIKENGEYALTLASQLSGSRPGEVVVVGWANSNILNENTGLPNISAKLYVPGYKILSIQMDSNGTVQECQSEF